MLDIFVGLMRYYAMGNPLTRQKSDGSYEYVPGLLAKAMEESRYHEYFSMYSRQTRDILYDYQGDLLTIEQLARWDPVFSLAVLAQLNAYGNPDIQHDPRPFAMQAKRICLQNGGRFAGVKAL